MLLVRGMLTVALVATLACASHAQRIAKGATLGVKAQVAEIDPALARTLGDEHARGAVTGTLAELGDERNRALLDALVNTASEAAARGAFGALSPAGQLLSPLVDRAVASAVGSVGRSLAADTTLRDQLAEVTHRLSASAVYGARDALADIFPRCAGSSDRSRCVEDEVGELSRAAAHGMMAGFVGALRWPILALTFLAGALVALLFVRTSRAVARTREPAPHPHQQP